MLTPRQQEVLDLIRRYIADNGLPPTRVEIAGTLGFKSPNAAEEHLQALARKGMISLVPGTSRGIRLVEQLGLGLPIVGRVAAGQPILAEENIEDHVNMDVQLFKPRADYLLRVRGQSMKDAAILDGDLLAVHRTSEVTNGQIVVARLENDVTVKRWSRRGNIVRLLPENPDFEPIEVDLRDAALAIEGIGVGIIRAGKFK
jgi:repressor LexA